MLLQPHPLAAVWQNCQISFLLIDWSQWCNKPSNLIDELIASITSSLSDWLAKLLPQQFQHIVRVLVPLSTHAVQLHRLEVGVGRDVGGWAVQFIQSKPEGIRIHLDQLSENAVEKSDRSELVENSLPAIFC